MAKIRYAQVGLGSRSLMYTEALVTTYAHLSELVGLCDSNPGRAALRAEWVKAHGIELPVYLATDYERMLMETRPDCVIITTKDSTHDDYICRAMELGFDVITEKPMTIDAARCQRIIDTQKKTGRTLRVTFNYRYSPPRTQIKDMLMSGIIGEIISVDFHWLLDTRHGADYFRRWHRNKENSGGLMVHKATHHFDMINWWLSTIPESVYATGGRSFYVPRTADRYGLTQRSERCYDCREKSRCPFFLDITMPGLKEMYLDQESYDGYFRDQCVFSAAMNIEDHLNLVVNYKNGVKLSYSLNAFMPWEGYTVSFNGTKGRIEHKAQETVYVSGDGSVPGALKREGTTIHVYPHFKPAYAIEVWQAKGGHGGGDTELLRDIFDPDPAGDRYMRAADQRAGAYSILTGIAANQSISTGRQVQIDDLVQGIGYPDYPTMPSSDDPLPLPL